MKIFLSLLIFLTFITPVFAKDKVLNIQEVTSPNNIKAWLVEDHSLPIIAISFAFKDAGAVQNSPDKQGVSQLLSNTMDEGAGDLSSQEFQKALTDHSITLYFNSNRDNFGGQLKTLSRHKEKAFELLKLALTETRFDQEPFERMRQSNISRVKSSMGDPEWISARIFNDIAFSGHPYAQNSGGTLTSLNNITIEDLKNHKNNWLTKDRLVIGVMGDITKEELSNILDGVFGNLPATGKENNIQKFNLQNTAKTFIYDKDIPQTIISSAVPSLDKNDLDYITLQVLNYIYGGGGFGSRLMEEAREKKGLTYGIYSSLMSEDYTNYINISTSTQNNSTKEVLDIIKNEMVKITNYPVGADELKDAQSYITGSMPLSMTSTDKVANILLNLQLDDRDISYLDKFKTGINNVTVQDVQRVAKRVFKPDNLLTILVGKPENIEKFENIEKLKNVE